MDDEEANDPCQKDKLSKSKSSIVSTMSGMTGLDDEASSPTVLVTLLLSDSDSDDKSSSNGDTPGDTSIAQGDGENLVKNGELEGAKQRIIERDERRSMCSDTKNVTLPHAKNATGPERRPSVIKRAGKRWGKLKSAIKVRRAMKDVQRNSKAYQGRSIHSQRYCQVFQNATVKAISF